MLKGKAPYPTRIPAKPETIIHFELENLIFRIQIGEDKPSRGMS